MFILRGREIQFPNSGFSNHSIFFNQKSFLPSEQSFSRKLGPEFLHPLALIRFQKIPIILCVVVTLSWSRLQTAAKYTWTLFGGNVVTFSPEAVYSEPNSYKNYHEFSYFQPLVQSEIMCKMSHCPVFCPVFCPVYQPSRAGGERGYWCFAAINSHYLTPTISVNTL